MTFAQAPTDVATTKACLESAMAPHLPTITRQPYGWRFDFPHNYWIMTLRAAPDGSTQLAHDGWLSSALDRRIHGQCGVSQLTFPKAR